MRREAGSPKILVSGNWLFQSSVSWCWPKGTWALGTRLRPVCFCNPCARAEWRQQERARKLCSATLIRSPPAISNEDRNPLDLPLCFQSFTFCYFELSYFEFPAISTLSFFPYTLNKPRYFELVKNNQSRLSRYKILQFFGCRGSRDSTANKSVAIHDRQKY